MFHTLEVEDLIVITDIKPTLTLIRHQKGLSATAHGLYFHIAALQTEQQTQLLEELRALAARYEHKPRRGRKRKPAAGSEPHENKAV